MSDKKELKGILKNKQVLEGFEQDGEENNFQFKAGSKQVTEKIDKKLQRQFVEKQKNKMGKQEYERMIKKQEKKAEKKKNNQEQSDSDLSSSDEIEDEFGDLVNEKLQAKFISTLAKLRNKNKEIYDENKQFFSESDFENEDDSDEDQEKDKKKFSYKEMVQRDIQKKMDNEDDSEEEDSDEEIKKKFSKRGETPHEEQLRIQREFKEKSKMQFGQENDGDDDDLFQVKKKSQLQLEDEDEAFGHLVSKLSKKKQKQEEKEVKQMWGEKEQLDEKDQFLRNFILSKAWIDREDYEDAQNSQIDEEDEEREEEMEKFEHNYNFRFEEPGGAEIQTYSRNIDDTVRQKKSGRAEKRREKREEKQKEREQMEEQIKRLKNAKKQEIMSRLHKIEQIGGLKQEKLQKDANFEEFLEKDFNEEEYNEMMKKKFGKKYREKEDDFEEELEEYEERLIKDMELPEDEEEVETKKQETESKNKDKDVTTAKVNIPVASRKNLTKADVDAIQNEDEEGEEHNMICWYCDNCQRGLQPGEQRFDCLECPDYVLCKQCNGDGIHSEHKLKKFIVPQNCAPPEEDVLKDIISNFKLCKKCDAKLNEYTNIYTLQSDANSHLCEECFDKERYQQQQYYELSKASKVDVQQLLERNDLEGVKEQFSDDVIDQLVNEYYALDFEDVIAGGVKTKFKYSNVKPEGYGLSDEQILYSDPKLLNGLVSMKKLAPYRDDEGAVKAKVLKNKAKLKSIENSTKLVKYQIKKENERMTELEEKLRKMKKGKKNEKKIEKLTNKINKMKAQKKKPLTAEFFKKLGKEEESSDEEEGNYRHGKKPRMQLTDLSQKKEKIKVSANRLSTYGIANNE